VKFLEKCFGQRAKKSTSQGKNRLGIAQKIAIASGIIGVVIIICLIISRKRKKR